MQSLSNYQWHFSQNQEQKVLHLYGNAKACSLSCGALGGRCKTGLFPWLCWLSSSALVRESYTTRLGCLSCGSEVQAGLPASSVLLTWALNWRLWERFSVWAKSVLWGCRAGVPIFLLAASRKPLSSARSGAFPVFSSSNRQWDAGSLQCLGSLTFVALSSASFWKSPLILRA